MRALRIEFLTFTTIQVTALRIVEASPPPRAIILKGPGLNGPDIK